MKLPKNTELWAISVESPQASDAFKKNNHAKGNPISFPLLWDEDNKIINAFGLLDQRYKGGNREGIPYASTYVITKRGWSPLRIFRLIIPNDHRIKICYLNCRNKKS